MTRIGLLPGSRKPIVDAHIIVGLEPLTRLGTTKPFGVSHVGNAAREWFENRFGSYQKAAGLLVTEGTHVGWRGVVIRERVAVVTITSAVFAGDTVVTELDEVEEMLNNLAIHLAEVCQQLKVQVIFRRHGLTEAWLVGALPEATDTTTTPH